MAQRQQGQPCTHLLTSGEALAEHPFVPFVPLSFGEPAGATSNCGASRYWQSCAQRPSKFFEYFEFFVV
jgi:hypothetical protein